MVDKKTSILFITHADKKGGAEQSLIHLINYLDSRKYQIYLMCPENASYLKEIKVEYEKVSIRLHSIKHFFRYIKSVLSIKAFVKKNHIDIIHANGWRAPWFAAPLKFLTNGKLIWHHRDFIQKKIMKSILPYFFDRVICISQFVAGSIQGRNHTVIYNGIDLSSASAQKKRRLMEDDVLVMSTFGRFEEWKRYHLVIEAVKKLIDHDIRNWILLIVGDVSIYGSDTYYKELVQKVGEYGLDRNIIFYGYSNNPIEIMQQSDLTINFSKNEPFGRVIIESLQAQTPVIVSNSGGAPEIIKMTHGGLIVKDGDVDELFQTIHRVYNHAVNYQNLQDNGYTNVISHFNMKLIAHQVEQVYHTLLAGNKQSRKYDLQNNS